MAEPAHADAVPDYRRGDMPSEEQVHTFRDVMGLIKWGGLAVICLVLVLTLTFCTAVGLLPALVITAVVAAAGGFYFSRKPAH